MKKKIVLLLKHTKTPTNKIVKVIVNRSIHIARMGIRTPKPMMPKLFQSAEVKRPTFS